jgi:peptidyl-prolyl cis-trans isomerase SurA
MYKILLFLGCIAVTNVAKAQPPQSKKILADKIIGQVGDRIILRSDIFNAIADYKRQSQSDLPPNPECAFLEGQLIQKALILQAEKDSLPINDESVDADIDQRVRGAIRELGSVQALEDVYGKSVNQLKEEFRTSIKERKMADEMRRKVVDKLTVTPNEVKAYFEKIPKDSLAYYESELELLQIIAEPKADKGVDDYIIKQLYEYKRQIESGLKKFEQVAQSVTEDPGSKQTGGYYAVNRNDKFWDPTFLSTVFKLKEGQISNVFKSKFGYHIMQLISRNGDEAAVRHILRIPPVTEQEVIISIALLDTAAARVNRKELTFGEALAKYSDDDNNKASGGVVGQGTGVTIDELDKELVVALKDAKPGTFLKPQVFTDQQGQKRIRLIFFKSISKPHVENIKEDYAKIAQRALDEKKGQALEKWFKEHLPNYYIMIDSEFENCGALNDWFKYAKRKN